MNTIERHVLELIGENVDSPDVFLDTDSGMEPIRDSINDAIEEITLFSGAFKGQYYIALREARTFYRLVEHIAWITDVWLVSQRRRLDQTSLIKLINFNPRWLYNTGSPWTYFPLGFNILGVYPKPATDTDLLEITAVMIPLRYTKDTDRVKLRKNWEWAAAHYAVGEFYASRGDSKSAVLHHNKYLKRAGMNFQYPDSNERQWTLNTWPKVEKNG